MGKAHQKEAESVAVEVGRRCVADATAALEQRNAKLYADCDERAAKLVQAWSLTDEAPPKRLVADAHW